MRFVTRRLVVSYHFTWKSCRTSCGDFAMIQISWRNVCSVLCVFQHQAVKRYLIVVSCSPYNIVCPDNKSLHFVYSLECSGTKLKPMLSQRWKQFCICTILRRLKLTRDPLYTIFWRRLGVHCSRWKHCSISLLPSQNLLFFPRSTPRRIGFTQLDEIRS